MVSFIYVTADSILWLNRSRFPFGLTRSFSDVIGITGDVRRQIALEFFYAAVSRHSAGISFVALIAT